MVPSRSSSVSPFALRSTIHLEFINMCDWFEAGVVAFSRYGHRTGRTLLMEKDHRFLAELQWGLGRACVILLLDSSL